QDEIRSDRAGDKGGMPGLESVERERRYPARGATGLSGKREVNARSQAAHSLCLRIASLAGHRSTKAGSSLLFSYLARSFSSLRCCSSQSVRRRETGKRENNEVGIAQDAPGGLPK